MRGAFRAQVAELKRGMQAEHLAEKTPTNKSKQRTLDYVDNLEKQHMQNLQNALVQAGAERTALLEKLTSITEQISKTADGAGFHSGFVGGLPSGPGAYLMPSGAFHRGGRKTQLNCFGMAQLPIDV